MRTRSYDNDPDRPDDPASPAPDRFTIHDAQPGTPQTMGTQAELDAFIRTNTRRNAERAADWLKREGIEP